MNVSGAFVSARRIIRVKTAGVHLRLVIDTTNARIL